ncbi:P-loop containing nucleoside triphosphate hydrolase protein [Mycena floridula]|nr:P-loop containing nucleoside triphosphate hydrolase protein [Mycena floridula]KAJ7584682.1 P-loop containing nucleoside triphosphate hydrolase protein [Mycena floridula]
MPPKEGRKTVKSKHKFLSHEVPKQTRAPLTPKDLENLPQLIKEHLGWSKELRPFQLEAIRSILLKKDVLIHAGTGCGKTAIAAGPHAHPSTKGKVTLMISPLIALHTEQVQTFTSEFKLTATAVNSAHGGCNAEKLKDITNGKWQIVVISPEMLLSRRFLRNVLQNSAFASRVLNVVIDEAHVVSHWGKAFRKKYGQLGIIRAFLPKGTPVVAMSATLPVRVRHDVLSKLQYKPGTYTFIDIGNDRPNVSLVVRAMQNTMNTFTDLDFLIPDGVTKAEEVQKGFVYADNITTGTDIEDHLGERLPAHLRGIIRPYNAAHSVEYRDKVMELFKAGIVRILICTDAAGMGCNIPDIDIVVQWKLPGSMSIFLQRAGRAARAGDRTGLAVLLVEATAYGIDIVALKEAVESIPVKGRGNRKGKKKNPSRKLDARARGVQRGSIGGKHDHIFVREQPMLDPEADDEGLLVFVQTGLCRRHVLSSIYQNAEAAPTVPCCDICDPSLLDRTRPGRSLIRKRRAAAKKGLPCISTQEALHLWRCEIHERDFQGSLFPASGLMSDKTLELLASVGPVVKQKAKLTNILVEEWQWFEKYGDELHARLLTLEIPEFMPLPKKTAQSKRKAAETNSNAAADINSRPSRSTDKRQKQAEQSQHTGSATIPNVSMAPIPPHQAPAVAPGRLLQQPTAPTNSNPAAPGPQLVYQPQPGAAFYHPNPYTMAPIMTAEQQGLQQQHLQDYYRQMEYQRQLQWAHYYQQNPNVPRPGGSQ